MLREALKNEMAKKTIPMRLAKEVRCIDDKCETRKNAEVDLQGLAFSNSVWTGGGEWADISAAKMPALLEESDADGKW